MGPEVDDQLELGRLFDRQVSRLLASEGLVDIDRDVPVKVIQVGSVAQLAQQHLGQRNVSLADAAYLLGFHDQSSFFRASQRWFGEPALGLTRRRISPLPTFRLITARRMAGRLYRLKGLLLLATRRHRRAAYFELALNVARQQQARSLELGVATASPGCGATKGWRSGRMPWLAPVYGWFTEGFDTPDLKEAKALLDELDA